MKTVTKQLMLLLLLLCLAVFTVACNQEVPGEQLPPQPDASTTEDTDTTQEIDTPTPEQPPEKELPPELTAPLTETFADADKKRINEVNRALKDSGISEINAKEFFRTQHADTYIGSLGVSELYLEQDAQGEEHIVRLVFEEKLTQAGIYSVKDAAQADWINIETLTPADLVGLREDALLTLLNLAVKDAPYGTYYEIEWRWWDYLSPDLYFTSAIYFSLPEESGARYICITHNYDVLCDVSLYRPVESARLPDDFYPTPDVLKERSGFDYVLSTLYNSGYDIADRDAVRALLREIWADDLLQSNDDYDTYRLPSDPATIARVASIGQRTYAESYTVPADQIDVRPIAVSTPADILATGEDMLEYAQAAMDQGLSGYAASRFLLIEYWSKYYIGSDDLIDYFYATVPTEQQIAANEPVDVLAICYPFVENRNTFRQVRLEQHGADKTRFGSAGIDVPSLDALLKITSGSLHNYFSILCRAHGLSRTELREELNYAWRAHHLRVESGVITNKYTYHTEEPPYYATSSETRAVEADIYYIHELDAYTMENLQEPGYLWIEYYAEDDTLRKSGRGAYTPQDSYLSE